MVIAPPIGYAYFCCCDDCNWCDDMPQYSDCRIKTVDKCPKCGSENISWKTKKPNIFQKLKWGKFPF